MFSFYKKSNLLWVILIYYAKMYTIEYYLAVKVCELEFQVWNTF